ncbi:MAG: ABC transporter permease [Desulfurococcales archaeon]|nr:ABC transporter permease [Desulfurococcales archaeon]
MVEQLVDALRMMVFLSIPYSLASLGIMIGGRAGVFNITTEGMMLLGASTAFLASYFTGGNNLVGLLAASAMGAVIGVLFAYLTVTLKLDQFVIGLTLFILTTGLGSLLYKVYIGVTLEPPRVPVIEDLRVPLLASIPVVGDVVFNQNAMVYFTILLALALHYLLFKTMLGLNLRSVGENPRAADSLGINVYLTQYLTTIAGSTLMSLAGAYLVLAFTGVYTDYIVGGRGWIAIALTLFGRWSPIPILLGSLLFSGVETLVFQLQAREVAIPYQFLLMLPFIVTLIVLIWVYRRAELPQALGKAYDREAIEE